MSVCDLITSVEFRMWPSENRNFLTMIFDRFLKCLKPVIRATEAVSDDRRIYKRRIQLDDRCTSESACCKARLSSSIRSSASPMVRTGPASTR